MYLNSFLLNKNHFLQVNVKTYVNNTFSLVLVELKLVVNEFTTAWKDSFVFCNNQSFWHQIFNHCQPGTCNVSSVVDKILDKSNFGLNQYWIYGYVLRSPVIATMGKNTPTHKTKTVSGYVWYITIMNELNQQKFND